MSFSVLFVVSLKQAFKYKEFSFVYHYLQFESCTVILEAHKDNHNKLGMATTHSLDAGKLPCKHLNVFFSEKSEEKSHNPASVNKHV